MVGDVALRVDEDETFAGMCWIQDNFAQMFYAGADRRLELVVDLQRPTPASSCLGQNLNLVQVIGKVLAANDFALLLVMPGTGKTTVVTEVSRRLEKAGKTVLVALYASGGEYYFWEGCGWLGGGRGVWDIEVGEWTG